MRCEDILDYIDIEYKKEGNNQYRIKNKNHNIVIRNNSYYDNYNTITGKGKGCINFYMYIKNATYLETIKKLDILYSSFSSCIKNNEIIKINFNNSPKEKKINKNFIKKDNCLPIINTNNINLIIEYLNKKRYISLKLINYLISRNYLSSDINKNCIFYNEDRTYAFLRGINSNFKKHAGVPDFIIYKNSENPLYLFESIIDMISYIDLNNGNIIGKLASVGGNMMLNKIEKLINNNVNEIIYCFDNDRQGKENVKYIINKLKGYNIKHKEIYPKNKDWNDELKHTKIPITNEFLKKNKK